MLDLASSLGATYPLVRLPTTERPERGLFISLAAVALQAVHDAEMKLGDAVSVHGLGTIGLLVVQMCRLEGIQNVYASPVGAAGRIYVLDRGGPAAVLEAGRALKALALNTLDDGFDASPAVAGDDLFLRGRRYLYRIAETPSGEER